MKVLLTLSLNSQRSSYEDIDVRVPTNIDFSFTHDSISSLNMYFNSDLKLNHRPK